MASSYKFDKDSYAKTPCLQFAMDGKIDELRRIIHNPTVGHDKINFVYKKSGDTPLILASRYGHASLVSFLIDNGGIIEHRNNDGKTALHDAAQGGHLECVNVLLQSKAQVDVLKRADWYVFAYLHYLMPFDAI